ncbi:alpha/beta fold hydrolase [Pontibacter cellulosilyticus]|uniref:Alpha/beta hydrolase n=1 Tax=Pontibacter cellulosilyticus TaxID=1720253 RepID=A0A923N832_9BACT|nr:alpha/beta hydrolase [Pontibacter cellulosilyticus]MBC5993479.1 alpha/beta hydrolase [Pontibacter cellulosilyticus]
MKFRKKHVALAAVLTIAAATSLQIRQDIPAEELNTKYTTPASKFISIAGANLHYRDEGQGTPIILLHGTAASLNTWDGWTKELSKTHRVLRLDLPGFGLTGRNQTDTYSIAYYSELVQQFMDEMGIDKAHIAGSSLGGQIAYDFAASHPERVQKLILVSPTGVTNANDKSISMPFLMAQTPLLKESLKYITPRFIVEKSLKEVYGDDSRLTDEAITLSHDLLLREGNREAFILRMNTVDEDNLAKLTQVKAPTLILWGEADAWVPAHNSSRFLKDIKGSELKTYAGAGHIPMEELSQETVQDALAFLGSEIAANN